MPVQTESEVRPQIRSLLGRLRGRIRQYVLIDAVARLVVLLGLLFWLSFGMNWAYFWMSNLELPVWFRMAFGWVSMAGSLLFAGWLILPLLRIMRAKALALVLERKFPELDDRLITAVEVAQSRTGQETELSAHMLKNTIDGVSRAVDQVHIGEVFERGPLRRSQAIAFTLLVSVATLAVVNSDALARWRNAYINYDEVYWDRETAIIIQIVAQPNDRVKDFLDEEGHPTNGQPGAYKHPRDEDLSLIVEVPHRAEPVENLTADFRKLYEQLLSLKDGKDETARSAALKQAAATQATLIDRGGALPLGSQLQSRQSRPLKAALTALKSADLPNAVKQQKLALDALDELARTLRLGDWKVPDEIELSYRRADGRGSKHVTLKRKSKDDRQFRHSIASLTDSIESLNVKGGDFANRRPYRIIVVDPPQIDRVVLECDYPDYTGYDVLDTAGRPVRDPRVLAGRQIALPLETDFLLHSFGNKPLLGVRFQADINERNVREIEVDLKPFRPDRAGSTRLTVRAEDGGRRTVDFPPLAAWRFRLIPQEMALHKRFADVVRAVKDIRESKAADGQVHRLRAASAAEAIEQLAEMAEESAAIERDYRKLLKEMDRKPLYPRLMVERMRESILAPLADVNAVQFPAADRLLAALQTAGSQNDDVLNRTLEARKGVDSMLLAMNGVLAEMSDGARFDVPFHVTARAADQLADPDSPIALPIPLPADREMRIYLEDTDDIIGTAPARVTVNGTVDQPPVIEARLRGISTAITRKASIPVTGTIRDDYGIVTARFEFLVDAVRDAAAEENAAADGNAAVDPPEGGGNAADAGNENEADNAAEETKWRVRPFRTRPEDNPLEFTLQRSPDDRYAAEHFEVLPLDLAIGQELTLTVYAQDGDNLNGPHEARGEKYKFRIVSNEELLSILYGRELNIRRRFEQIIEELKEAKDDLVLHRTRVEEADALRAAGPQEGKQQEYRDKLKEIDVAVSNSASRSFHQVSKNHGETRDVAQSFLELLEELMNNRVHTEEQVNRIELLIVRPLDGINKDDFPAVITAVNLFKQAHEDGKDPKPRIDDSVAALNAMIQRMEAVLAEIEDLADFHEALKDLQAIIDIQGNLTEEAREAQKKEAIERLKNLNKLDLD